MINFIHNIFISDKSENIFLKIILFLAIIYIYLYIYKLTAKPIYTENFSQQEQFVVKKGDDIFDQFYAEIYDSLHDGIKRNDLELTKVLKNTNLDTNNSAILDVGSGTGNTVYNLDKAGFNVYGIDKSKSMIDYANQKYPNIELKQGNVLDSMAFEHSTFTHILCTYFTIYYIENKSLFFQNCYHWMKPNSYLVLHLADLTNFNQIIPMGIPNSLNNTPQYNKHRVVNTLTVFTDFKYKAYYTIPTEKDKNNATLIESFTDNITQNVRQNEHTLYMEPMNKILNMVRRAGFSLIKTIHMKKINNDENQFLYFFHRPL